MEIAGLSFGALGTLELCLKVSKDVNEFVRRFKAVSPDLEWASTRLSLHDTEFRNWIDFWDIKKDTPAETFRILWGLDGTNAIEARLERIKDLCTKATESQKKYKCALEKQGSLARFCGKFRFAYSGREQLEGYLNRLRSELNLVVTGAERYFVGNNHGFAIGSISKVGVRSLVEESAMVGRAIPVQETSTKLFKVLKAQQPQSSLDLALQPDYVSKLQFLELHFDAKKLSDESAKFPIIVNNTSSKIKNTSPPSVFVLEAGKKGIFEASDRGLREEDLDSIVLSTVKEQSTLGMNSPGPNESFFLKSPSSAGYEKYRFLAHSTTPHESLAPNPKRLEELFDNRPRDAGEPPSRLAPISLQFDLAYTLAISVLNLKGSGWLHALHSRNIYRRENLPKLATLSVKVYGNDIFAPKETPLDKIFRRSHFLEPEIFRLGILLLEIGLARSASAIFKDLENDTNAPTLQEKSNKIFSDLEYCVCPAYTEVTRVCLEGDFDFDQKLDNGKIMRSYISAVIEPLRTQIDAIQKPRRKGRSWQAQALMPSTRGDSGFAESSLSSLVSGHKRRTPVWDRII